MELIVKIFNLPKELVYYILDFLEFDYYEYYFYRKPRRQKGMVVIKYPLYRFFTRDEDAVGYLAVKEEKKEQRKRKPRADTI
jgi:hypothetical protein